MNFDGMWAEPDSDPREALEPGRGERAVLAEYLDRYRMTFELKCEGLTAEQLATRSVPPSTMSLLGMIRHLARVEHSWTRRATSTARRPRRATSLSTLSRSMPATSATSICCVSASTAARASRQ
jgi:hypothetical protein